MNFEVLAFGIVTSITVVIGIFLFLWRKDIGDKVKKDLELNASRQAMNEAVEKINSQKNVRQKYEALRSSYSNNWDSLGLRSKKSMLNKKNKPALPSKG
jgi:hypothetical protein